MLSISQLNITRGKKKVLDSFSCTLAAGECLALVGRNGSGKSSILQSLSGEIATPPSSAFWKDDGGRQVSVSELRRRQELGYLPQTIQPMENIQVSSLFGTLHEEAQHQELTSLLQFSEAKGIVLPSLLSRSLRELSGGELQLVFLVFAILSAKKILLLDEPSNNLDGLHRLAMLELLHWIFQKRKIAVLIASHDEELLSVLANRFIFLSQEARPVELSQKEFFSSAFSEKVFPKYTCEKKMLYEKN